MCAAFLPRSLSVTPAASLREGLEDPAPVAHESSGRRDGLAFVLAEQDLSTVLALVGVYELDSRKSRQALDRSLVPRGGVGWMLMKEQPPTLNLFHVDADHEV